MHARVHSHTYTHTHSLTHSHVCTHSLPHAHRHARTHACVHSHTHSLTHSETHACTHTCTQSLAHSLTHSLMHARTHARTCALTHSLTHTPTLSPALVHVNRCNRGLRICFSAPECNCRYASIFYLPPTYAEQRATSRCRQAFGCPIANNQECSQSYSRLTCPYGAGALWSSPTSDFDIEFDGKTTMHSNTDICFAEQPVPGWHSCV